MGGYVERLVVPLELPARLIVRRMLSVTKNGKQLECDLARSMIGMGELGEAPTV